MNIKKWVIIGIPVVLLGKLFLSSASILNGDICSHIQALACSYEMWKAYQFTYLQHHISVYHVKGSYVVY